MSKKEIITIEDILKRKDFYKNKKVETKELYIRSIDSNIVIKKPDKELMYDVSDMSDKGNDKDADNYLVYESIVEPNLKDPKLQEAFKDSIENPMDILFEIFDPMEVSGIASQIVIFAGLNGVKEIEDVKK